MIYQPDLPLDRYFVGTYYLECRESLARGAWQIAVGQSIGNPDRRSAWETPALIAEHAAKVLHSEADLAARTSGTVRIAFPKANIRFAEDGVAQLLCQVMGGQMDIDDIECCQLLALQGLDDPSFVGPAHGIEGIRHYTGVYGRPLVGGIVKPKMGLRPPELLRMVQEMVEGGVDFIKEDEIMSNPASCPLEQRVPLISTWLRTHAPNVIYAVSATADPVHVLRRARQIYDWGGNAMHVNVWGGLGTYKSLRELDTGLFLFFQKSGDRVFTSPHHRFSISWPVICDLAGRMGVDFIHAGMWGGYLNTGDDLPAILDTLRPHRVLPSLSCGMTPELVPGITAQFGVDYMATSGGYIHSHPDGTRAGARALRRAAEQR